ncbi:MAG TPA: metal-dependent phosphohydrolase [Synergistaceae bacterium]|nr:MAG: Metal dependent phosphohydrolase [Synergistales bacterium 53_16]HAA47836.1 metal-dependent phosphohydrolase [Synergistaceae bacterium]HAG21969.1 metal-dependent phosphohydrolase [Synergistaceae bacterium]
MNKDIIRSGAVILAAGLSSRMGRCKALLDAGGTSALGRVSCSMRLCGVEDLVVVTGYHRDQVEKEAVKWGGKPVFNDSHEEGMFSSIRTGVAALSKDVEAFFLLPVDIPLVRKETCLALKGVFLENPEAAFVVPSFRNKKGHPPLIASRLVPEILEWSGDGGLRALLSHHEENSFVLETPDQGVTIEMDTPEDYENLYSLAKKREIPSKEESIAFFELCGTPSKVREHSEVVAKVAKKLADNLKGLFPMEPESLWTAALLHDMKRTEIDHAEEGAATLEKWGFAETADLVRFHMELPDDEPLLSGRSLLYLADKIVAGTEATGLDKRWRDVREKFSGNPAALKSACSRLQKAENIARAFEACTGKRLKEILTPSE